MYSTGKVYKLFKQILSLKNLCANAVNVTEAFIFEMQHVSSVSIC